MDKYRAYLTLSHFPDGEWHYIWKNFQDYPMSEYYDTRDEALSHAPYGYTLVET